MRPSVPVVKDLVLVGGGHSHVHVLLSFGMRPVPGVRLTVVCREPETPYSGMLPGHVAGHYRFDEMHIDLAPLCAFAGARLYRDEAVGLDLAARRVLCRDRPPVAWDVLSINTGSAPDMSDVPGAAAHTVAVKPIGRFLAAWGEIVPRLAGLDRRPRIAVVGEGAGGVEILLAVGHRLGRERAGRAPPELHLFGRTDILLPGHDARTRRRFRRILAGRGVALHLGQPVVAVEAGGPVTADGCVHPADAVLWVGSAGAPAWPAAAGLAADARGFVRVDAGLRSVSDPSVFAAGDVAAVEGQKRPKAGVFAVRQGPPLAANLRRALVGRAPKPFRQQRRFLTILTTGGRHAVAARNGLSVEGDWVWRWKDRIDRRFMRRYSELPEMAPAAAPAAPAAGLADPGRLAELAGTAMRCGGCGAKVGSTVLARALARLDPPGHPDLLVGLGAPDDAAVLVVPPGLALVQSVDHFRALVDDPYLFGRIAANHSLGDLYAMGAEPRIALAVATVPWGFEEKTEELLFQLLAGAARTLREAGVALAGGHTGEGAEPALGFAVTGVADPARLLRKSGLCPGDRLILTKPVGTGTIFAAAMRGRAKGRWIGAAVEAMLVSSRAAAAIVARHGATACTDVTGFGLFGHLLEMVRASGVGARVSLAAVPLIEGAAATAAGGMQSSLQPENVRLARAARIGEGPGRDPRLALLFDPQTAGGLLAGLPAAVADECLAELRRAGYAEAAVIGSVLPATGAPTPIAIEE